MLSQLETRGSRSSPATDADVQSAYNAILFFGEPSMLDVWPEIVEPPETAALAAASEA